MLKFPCLVLDHDDTVVKSMKTLSYPFYLYVLEQLRPGKTISFEKFVLDCHKLGFADLCRKNFQFTEEELKIEHKMWMEYLMAHTPDAYEGIAELLQAYKAEGGTICVVSHSSEANIMRDYRAHFGVLPDAIYGWDFPEHQRKPHPYPLVDIMQRFGFTPEQILVVDDMQLSWQMANPLGIPFAYAGWTDAGIAEIEEEMISICDYHFKTVAEFSDFLLK